MIKIFKIFLIVITIVTIGKIFPYRVDLTIDKRYEISEETEMLLKKFNQPLKIDILLHGKMPSEYHRLRRETKELLKSMQQKSNKIIFEFIDPFKGEDDLNELISEMERYGILPEVTLENQNQEIQKTIFFPWAIVSNENKSVLVPLVKRNLGDNKIEKINRSIRELEKEFYKAFFKINLKQKKRIAVLTSHKTSTDILITDFIKSLQKYYQVASFDLKALENDPQKTLENLNRFELLIVSNPKEKFNYKEKYIFDQFTIGGGRSLWLLNNFKLDKDSLFKSNGKSVAFYNNLNLDDIFFKYGIRLNRDIIEDMFCAPIVLAKGENNKAEYLPIPFSYYPLSKPIQNNLIGRGTSEIILKFPSSIDTLKNNLKKEILIKSSELSRTKKIPFMVSLEESISSFSPSNFEEKSKFIGVLISGVFKSAFQNRIKPNNLIDSTLVNGESEIIIISDGELAENQIENDTPLELGYDKWTNNYYSNKSFLNDCVHYLIKNKSLLNIKNKETNIGLLDKSKISENGLFWRIFMLLIAPFFLYFIGLTNLWNRKIKFSK
ncbi:MAG: gliding motility-associated ABC transporter substrate-binding protein GldG [Bacteroidota bacterium]|nr:gliding motility-associated ABC transporter substrate-binding protein GldG [Bacteroidota bacterium]